MRSATESRRAVLLALVLAGLLTGWFEPSQSGETNGNVVKPTISVRYRGETHRIPILDSKSHRGSGAIYLSLTGFKSREETCVDCSQLARLVIKGTPQGSLLAVLAFGYPQGTTLECELTRGQFEDRDPWWDARLRGVSGKGEPCEVVVDHAPFEVRLKGHVFAELALGAESANAVLRQWYKELILGADDR